MAPATEQRETMDLCGTGDDFRLRLSAALRADQKSVFSCQHRIPPVVRVNGTGQTRTDTARGVPVLHYILPPESYPVRSLFRVMVSIRPVQAQEHLVSLWIVEHFTIKHSAQLPWTRPLLTGCDTQV